MTKEVITPTDFEVAVKNLTEAQVEWENAKKAARVANAEVTECFNRLNAAQKEFDKLAGAVRASAPGETDWGRKNNERPERG